MASVNDKITDTRNAARPVSATVTSARAAGGTTLACDALTGWPTASKVHFVTYQIDSESNLVAGSQLDCYGIVSGTSITQIVVVDGTDNGSGVGDKAQMVPTAAWGQDLSDALMEEHDRGGMHTDVTANSITVTGNIVGNTIAERTAANGVTIDGLNIKDGKLNTADSVTPTHWTNPYAFLVRCSVDFNTSAGSFVQVPFDTVISDYNSNYNTTDKRYTAPVAGLYHFDASVALPTTGGATRWGLSLYVNGSDARRLLDYTFSTASSTGAINGGGSLVLAAGDYVDVRLVCSGTTSVDSNGSVVTTWFTGNLVSPQ
jgi:hypothetical protein